MLLCNVLTVQLLIMTGRVSMVFQSASELIGNRALESSVHRDQANLTSPKDISLLESRKFSQLFTTKSILIEQVSNVDKPCTNEPVEEEDFTSWLKLESCSPSLRFPLRLLQHSRGSCKRARDLHTTCVDVLWVSDHGVCQFMLVFHPCQHFMLIHNHCH